MATSEIVLQVDGLAKTFRPPLSTAVARRVEMLGRARDLVLGGDDPAATRGRVVEAVRGVSFEVRRGEIFGFLGPNGAGKTTTIKMLTGLIAPTRGRATLFGKPAPSPDAMGRVGFLPENPYIYPYLTPREFVTLCARLSDVGGRGLTARVEKAIARVGMSEAIDRPARNLSKGMLQRTGFAAAIVHDPELLILDEPMSGLDPVGRKEVRDLIVEERAAGRTVFFSSHILSDVEMLCNRVCILKKGEVVVSGTMTDLLDSGTRRSEVTLRRVDAALKKILAERGHALRDFGESVAFEVEGEDTVTAVLGLALEHHAVVEGVMPKRETLESVFVRRAL